MASSFRLEDVLSAFRALEENHDAVAVLGDDVAMRVLIAWTHVDNEWSPPTSKPPPILAGRMNRLWKWVVAGWDIDEIEIARVSGAPLSSVHYKMAILVGGRLIYPDGSIAKGTRLAIAAYTARRLGIKTGSKAPAAKPPTPGRALKLVTDDDDDN